MRFLCSVALVGLLAGCNNDREVANDRAKTVDPVVKTTPATAEPTAKPAAAPASQVAAAGSTNEQATAESPADKPKTELDRIIDKYADTGVDGVVDVMTDKSGAINKVVIVGVAPISTVLGAADGLLTARREARLRAAGKFRQFLKEKVSIEEKTETERVVKLESKQGSDLTESGQKVSKNSEKYQTISEGMVRGLQTLGYKVVSLNKKEKVYVMVCGWDTATSNATKGLAKDLDSDEVGGGKGSGDAGSPAERRELKDEQKTTPGAEKFFKKPPEPKP
jgi:hypothetical protein